MYVRVSTYVLTYLSFGIKSFEKSDRGPNRKILEFCRCEYSENVK